MHRSTNLFFRIIWFTTVWVLWKERNDRVFNNTASTPLILIEKVKLTSFLWLKSKHATFMYNYHDWWKKPLHCMGVHLQFCLFVYSDGALLWLAPIPCKYSWVVTLFCTPCAGITAFVFIYTIFVCSKKKESSLLFFYF